MKDKSINDFTDAELAAMIRNSTYARNTSFATGKTNSRFLLVFAVPYGPDDDVTDLRGAFDGLAELWQAEDWRERQVQCYDHETGSFFETAMENIENEAVSA